MTVAATHHDDPGEPLRPVALPDRPASDDVPGMSKEGGDGGRDLSNALTVLRARVDEEFRVAERLDAKARQAFALAAGFFAVVQTVAFGSYQSGGINSDERIWLLGVVIFAGLALVNVAHKLRTSEELRPEADINPEAIIEWWDEAPADDPDYVSLQLLRELARVARERADSNRARQTHYDGVAAAARLALIVAGVELLTAIIVRL